MDKATLVYKNGCWCARDSSAMLSEPTRITHYWPLEQGPHSLYAQEEGMQLWFSRGDWSYSARICGFMKVWYLPQGGQTQALVVDTEAIPCPKRAKSPRYYNGRWEKLTAKGYKPA